MAVASAAHYSLPSAPASCFHLCSSKFGGPAAGSQPAELEGEEAREAREAREEREALGK